MKVRRAEIKDIPRILELLDQVNLVHHRGRPDIFYHATKYTEAELEDVIKNDMTPGFVAVEEAEDGSENVLGHGFTIFQQWKNHNIMKPVKTLYIDDICVDEKARGRHAGKALYEFIHEFAKENKCHNITLNVWAFNEGAFKFYETMGLEIRNMTMEKLL